MVGNDLLQKHEEGDRREGDFYNEAEDERPYKALIHCPAEEIKSNRTRLLTDCKQNPITEAEMEKARAYYAEFTEKVGWVHLDSFFFGQLVRGLLLAITAILVIFRPQLKPFVGLYLEYGIYYFIMSDKVITVLVGSRAPKYMIYHPIGYAIKLLIGPRNVTKFFEAIGWGNQLGTNAGERVPAYVLIGNLSYTLVL